MKYLEPKVSASQKFYIIDYDKDLAGDTIQSYTADVSEGAIVIAKQVYKDNKIGLLVNDGAPDTESVVSINIATKLGQALSDTASIYTVDQITGINLNLVTKQQILDLMFQDLRLSGYTFDHSQDELAAALLQLDAMMFEYKLKGYATNYNFPVTVGMSKQNELAGIDSGLLSSVATLLACKYMDGIGKSYTPNLARKLTKAENFFYAYCRPIPNRELPASTLRGSGNRFYSIYYPYLLKLNKGLEGLILANANEYIPAAYWDEAYWNVGNWS